MEQLLVMEDIRKSFAGVRALDGVGLTLRHGTVHALMGENGAGKSTLMKCLFGIYQKDSGRILIEGEEVNLRDPKDAMDHGVAMVHQELSQATKRTVMDNIWLGRYPTRFGTVDEAKMYRDTKALFGELEIGISPREIVGNLSVAKRQMVEIAKAVSCNAKILVLDEPTSSLTDPEVEHLFRIIRRLTARGCGILYISHKMQEILTIANEVTVLRDGQYVGTWPAASLSVDEIIRRMVGRELTELYPPTKGIPEGELLGVEGLSSADGRVRDISFTLRRGEILGFAGLVGAGRTELMQCIFGMREIKSGSIRLGGQPFSIDSPRDAIRSGVAFVTEERRADGIFGGLSILENTCIARLPAYRGRLGLLSRKRMERDTRKTVSDLHVKTASIHTPIRHLSGGNQQKVILGRWLLCHPSVLILDEPTRGIDVGAKQEIYRLIASLKEEGRGVILISSEMPELIGMCDRLMVMSGGRIAGELTAEAVTQEAIMELASKYV